jgi:pimeloyl-ACP methyl ester carboxylesterase
MLIHSKTMTLPDGRTLAYAEYGDPAGYPLVWLHGSPGSRLEPDLLDPTLLARLHVRAVVPDRPGIGQSTPKWGRRVVDWPTDLAALAAALKLERFALLGVSGGAPYAAVCARAMPHRLTQVGIISGVAPPEALAAAPEARPGTPYFAFARRSLWLARGLIWLMRRNLHTPDKLIAQMRKTLPPADQAVLAEPRVRQAFLAGLHEAFRQGTEGPAWDAVLISRPWGFSLGKITRPVLLWHGEEDRNAPLPLAGYMAEQLPNSRLHIVPGEGHFSLLVRRMEAILAALVH